MVREMIFDAYAAYYDLLYKDKNYKEEARYVQDLIKKHHPTAHNILDLGCGTGKHAFEFASLGYKVVGVDISGKMIRIAKSNYKNNEISFYHADMRDVRLEQKFDVVLALFHVMCYQNEDEDLLKAFETASSHLNEGGILIFDCWYGPGVINDPPVKRIKKMENEQIEVHRIAEPQMYAERKIVNVDYEVHITEIENKTEQVIKEKHSMRYLFKPEIESLAKTKRLEVLAFYEWMKPQELKSEKCWNIAVVLRKNKNLN